jgi:hypothetical protein
MKPIRNTHITTLHRTIAYVLLISQLLTSCGGHETILPGSAAAAPTPLKSVALRDTAADLVAIDTAEAVVEASIATANPSSQHMRSPKPPYENDTPTQITLNPITATTPRLSHQRRKALNQPIVATKLASATKPRPTTRYQQPIRSWWHKAALLGAALYNSLGYVNGTTVANTQRTGIEPEYAGGLSIDAMGGGEALSVALSQNADYTLVAAWDGGLKVINIKDKSQPSLIGKLSMDAMGGGKAFSVTLNPHGDFALVAAHDGGLKVINMTDKTQPSLIGNLSMNDMGGGSVWSVALSPNGDFALVAARDGGLKVINIKDKSQPKLIGNLSMAMAMGGGYARSVALSNNEDFALVAALNGGLKMINITDKSQPKLIGDSSVDAMGGGDANSVALSPNGDFALVAAKTGGLKVINITNQSQPNLLGDLSMEAMGGGSANSVALSPHNDFALVAAKEGGLKVINIRDKTQPKLIGSLAIDKESAESVAVSRHADFALLAASIGGLKVINLHQYALQIQKNPPIASLRKLNLLSSLSIKAMGGREARSVAWSSNEDFALVAAGWNEGLKVINIKNKSQSILIGDLSNHAMGGGDANSVALSPNGDFALVAAVEGGLKVINIKDKSQPKLIGDSSVDAMGGGDANSVALSPNGDFALVAAKTGGLKVINITNQSQPSLIGNLSMAAMGGGEYALSVALSPNEDFALVAAGNGGLKVINLTNQSKLSLLGNLSIDAMGGGEARSVAWSSNEDFALVTANARGLKVINITDKTKPSLIGKLSMDAMGGGNAYSVALSPHNDFALVAAHAGGLKVINITDKTKPSLLGDLSMQAMGGGHAYSVVWSPHNDFALVAAGEGGLKVIDLRHAGLLDNPIALAIRHTTGIHHITDVIQVKVGIPAEFVVKVFNVTTQNNIFLQKNEYEHEAPEVVLDEEMRGKRDWINFRITDGKLKIKIPDKEFSGTTLQLIFPIRYKSDKYYHVIDFPVVPSLGLCTRENAASFLCKDQALDNPDKLTVTSPEATINLQMQIINETLRDRIVFVDQQFGALRASFNNERQTLSAFGPIADINDMLQKLRYSYKPGYKNDNHNPTDVLLKVTLNDGLNEEQVIKNNDIVNLGKFTENKGPVVTTPMQKQIAILPGISNGNELIINHEFDFSLAENTFQDSNNQTLTYSPPKLPAWLQFNAFTRKFSGKPDKLADMKCEVIALTASDGYDSIKDNFTLNVTNIAPVIKRPLRDQLQTISNIRNGNQLIIGQAFDFTFASDTFVSDAHDRLSLQLQGKPSWLTFDSDARKLYGRPDKADQMQLYTMELTASDGYDSITDSFTLNVTNIPPSWKTESRCDSLIQAKYAIDEKVEINLESCIENKAKHTLYHEVRCTKKSNHEACAEGIATLDESTKMLTIAPKSPSFSFDGFINHPTQFLNFGDYGDYQLTLTAKDPFGGKFEKTFDTNFDFQYDKLAWFALKRALLLISPFITIWGYKKLATYFYSMCYKEQYIFNCDPVDVGETYNLKFKVRKQKSIADAAWLLQAMQEANSLDEAGEWYDRFTDLARPDILERAIEDIVTEQLAAIKSQHMLQYGIMKIKDCFYKHALSRRLSRLDGNHEFAMKYIQKAINEAILATYPAEAVDHMDKILQGVSISTTAISGADWLSTLVNSHGEINKNLLDRYASKVVANRGEEDYDTRLLRLLLLKAHYAEDYGLTVEHDQIIDDESAYYLTIKAFNQVPDPYLSKYRKWFKESHIKWFNMNYQSMPQSSDYRAPSPMPMWLNCSISNDQIEFYGKPSNRDIGTYVIQILNSAGYILKEFKVVVQENSMTTAALGLPRGGSVRELGRRTRMLNSMTSHGSIASQVAGQEIEMALLSGVGNAIPEEWLTASGQVGMDDE